MKKVVLLDNSNSWEAAGDLQRGAAFSQRDMAAEDLSGTSRVPGSLQQAPETSRVNEMWPNLTGQARGLSRTLQHQSPQRKNVQTFPRWIPF